MHIINEAKKYEDTVEEVEEVEEEVYHDAVDEERGKRESSKDERTEEDGEFEIKVIKQKGV